MNIIRSVVYLVRLSNIYANLQFLGAGCGFDIPGCGFDARDCQVKIWTARPHLAPCCAWVARRGLGTAAGCLRGMHAGSAGGGVTARAPDLSRAVPASNGVETAAVLIWTARPHLAPCCAAQGAPSPRFCWCVRWCAGVLAQIAKCAWITRHLRGSSQSPASLQPVSSPPSPRARSALVRRMADRRSPRTPGLP